MNLPSLLNLKPTRSRSMGHLSPSVGHHTNTWQHPGALPQFFSSPHTPIQCVNPAILHQPSFTPSIQPLARHQPYTPQSPTTPCTPQRSNIPSVSSQPLNSPSGTPRRQTRAAHNQSTPYTTQRSRTLPQPLHPLGSPFQTPHKLCFPSESCSTDSPHPQHHARVRAFTLPTLPSTFHNELSVPSMDPSAISSVMAEFHDTCQLALSQMRGDIDALHEHYTGLIEKEKEERVRAETTARTLKEELKISKAEQKFARERVFYLASERRKLRKSALAAEVLEDGFGGRQVLTHAPAPPPLARRPKTKEKLKELREKRKRVCLTAEALALLDEMEEKEVEQCLGGESEESSDAEPPRSESDREESDEHGHSVLKRFKLEKRAWVRCPSSMERAGVDVEETVSVQGKLDVEHAFVCQRHL